MGDEEKKKCICDHCETVIVSIGGSTTTMKYHLKKFHPYFLLHNVINKQHVEDVDDDLTEEESNLPKFKNLEETREISESKKQDHSSTSNPSSFVDQEETSIFDKSPRKNRSLVWEHFNKDPTDEAKTTVICKHCSSTVNLNITSKSTTPMHQHLTWHHPDIANCLDQSLTKRRKF